MLPRPPELVGPLGVLTLLRDNSPTTGLAVLQKTLMESMILIPSQEALELQIIQSWLKNCLNSWSIIVYMVYMSLALESEILANNNSYLTGSGMPQDKLDSWKTLADVKLTSDIHPRS